MSIENILVGVDGREPSYRALAFSAGLARREAAALAICYVRPYVHWHSLALSSFPLVPLALPWEAAATQEAAFAAIAREVSAEAADTLNTTGIHGDVFLRMGDIAKELGRVAEERRADLIVVGTPRRVRSRSAAVVRRLTHGFNHGLFITP